MSISKAKRDIVFKKYNGKCAYSGTLLEPDWQIDHVKPKIMYQCGVYKGKDDAIENLVPCQKILNHYKRGLDLEDFRNWYLGKLHIRLSKLPKNPKAERSIKRKEYLLKVASYFDITADKPFDKIFYFERNKKSI